MSYVRLRALIRVAIGAAITVAALTCGAAAQSGPAGRVFASDLQPQMLELLRVRLAERHIGNVTLIHGTVQDPKLPASSIDLALLVDVYHEFSAPQRMLQRIRESLTPGGRLVLLEYRKEDPTIPIRTEHKMTVAEARMEVEAEHFHLDHVDERLPRQHILIFTGR